MILIILIKKITKTEALTILKNLFNDAVRHIFNESVSFCGECKIGDIGLSINGFFYSKSATFNSFDCCKTKRKMVT